MSVYTDGRGRMVVESVEGSPVGKFYVRRETVGDAGDCVVLKGFMRQELHGGGHRDLLIVSSATFGAEVPGWDPLDAPDATFELDEFTSEYREETDTERALRAVSEAADSQAATKAAAKRQSPWSRS